MNARHILTATLAIASLAPLVSAQSEGGPPPALVRVDAARSETLDRQRNVTGEVRAARRSSVASKSSGLVLQMPIEVGDTIKKGDLIAKLDDVLAMINVRRREAEVTSAEASIREQEAFVTRAKRDVDRIVDLRDRNGASKSELDDAVTDLDAANALLAKARADLATATAELAQAEQELQDKTVRAPFTGTVVRRDIELGQWIDEGETALELIEIERVDVYLDVPEAFIGSVTDMKRPITMLFAGGRITRHSEYTAIIDDADPEARTFPVRVRLDNSKGELRPGMSVTGVVPTGEMTESLTVHKDAILRDDAGSYVYFDAGGSAMPARITPLFAVGDRVAVRAPQLTDGAKLIVEGNERLFPTQPIKIVNEQPAGAPAREASAITQSN